MTSKINAQFILTDREWDVIEDAQNIIQDVIREIEHLKAFGSSPLEELRRNCGNIVAGIDYLLLSDNMLSDRGEE